LQVIKLFICISTAPAALDRKHSSQVVIPTHRPCRSSHSLHSRIPITQRDPAFRNSLLQKLQQPILKLVRCPRSLAPALVTLPSMSLIPFAPFGRCNGGSEARWIGFSEDDDMAISKGAGYQAAKPHLLLPTRPEVAFHLIDEKLATRESFRSRQHASRVRSLEFAAIVMLYVNHV
jgi:hypothetical protein